LVVLPLKATGCFANYRLKQFAAAFLVHQHHINITPKRAPRLPTMENKPLSKTWLRQILGAACRADHVLFVTRCISMAQLADSQVTVQEVLQEGLKRATNHAAMKCLHYVLELGADVHQLSPHWLVCTEGTNESMREVLEILVARGYDVNSESDGLPVLWYVGVGDYDFVKWCLDQGANVNPADQITPGTRRLREPLLERAAIVGNIDTFELLRSKGAPLDRKFGVFPKAVMAANYGPSKQQIRMLTHLLEVVGCDVNSRSYGPFYGSGSSCSAPLCWIACHPRGVNVKELVWFLLDHGGDLDLSFQWTISDNNVEIVQSARQTAQQSPSTREYNPSFWEAVKEWENRQRIGLSSEACK
jgi:hypothetical protein